MGSLPQIDRAVEKIERTKALDSRAQLLKKAVEERGTVDFGRPKRWTSSGITTNHIVGGASSCRKCRRMGASNRLTALAIASWRFSIRMALARASASTVISVIGRSGQRVSNTASNPGQLA